MAEKKYTGNVGFSDKVYLTLKTWETGKSSRRVLRVVRFFKDGAPIGKPVIEHRVQYLPKDSEDGNWFNQKCKGFSLEDLEILHENHDKVVKALEKAAKEGEKIKKEIEKNAD